MVLPISKPEDSSYRPLSGGGSAGGSRDLPWKTVSCIVAGLAIVGIVVGFLGNSTGSDFHAPSCGPIQAVMETAAFSSPRSVSAEAEALRKTMRGVSAGVSPKSNRPRLGDSAAAYEWNNSVLSWQRTAFHFQPEKNWMNDPNGPLFHKGWYHFFYQYNPHGAVWGDIVWGHAVSKDLIHWLHLPLAMVADQWYDLNGVWTGSATLLPDGNIMMLYTGATDKFVQVQNLAYPADLNDPLLLRWEKYPGNPVLVPPPCVLPKDFRDPTTAMLTSAGRWRIVIGSKFNKTGIVLVYDTDDFKSYDLMGQLLHAVPHTGMWECVDFYPVSTSLGNGMDTSANGNGVRHILKASMDDDRHDYYAIGTYHEGNTSWIPDHPEIDVGIGMRYDYGIFYASKTFYDQNKKRRILWGWIGESDNENADIKKGWASLQSVPRSVVLDTKTGSNLVQWPVEEVESLRVRSEEFKDVIVKAGSVEGLDVGSATQLDITADFEFDDKVFGEEPESDAEFSCRSNGGAAHRGVGGPFGVLVLADDSLTEYTPVYFYVAKGRNGDFNTHFCTDQSRSSLANDVNKQVFGNIVPVLKGEKLSLRILVDHSIVESFAQGGRSVITSRVYPTRAIYGAARVFVFNNATKGEVKASVKIWQMNSAFIHPYTDADQ